MKHERAVGIGQEALIWLAGEPELLGRLLDAAGLAPEALRSGAGDPEFLGFVLEFLLSDEATVLAFAAAAGLRPEDPGRARDVLGGALPNWT
jgi:Protein of unknown function (DUF3572)